MRKAPILAITALALLALAAPALATNGYFTLGYGAQYNGMAGAGQALHLSTMAGATNPATLAFVTGYDVSAGLFMPNREYTVSGNPSGYPGTFGLAPGTYESHSKGFVMPALGAAWHVSDKVHVGLTIYGNGGMNTNYPNKVFGTSPVGVNLMQAFVAPSVAYEFAPHQALGLSVIGAWQSFEAKGLGAFSQMSSNPAKLTNNGTDTALGYGARIGYHGKFGDYVGFGASYQTKMKMGDFKEYAGLYAEQGAFDIPENWAAGVSFFPAKGLSIAADVQEIYYSKVKSIGNPLLPNLMTAPLGADGGAGFGWKDMTVVKIGAQYEVSPDFTVRAGYSHGKQPIRESEVLFNILAPGVIEDHVTVGATAKVTPKSALSLAVIRALSHSVTGPNPLEAPGQQKIELKMDQWLVEVGYSFGF